ncbi:TrbI/VirB10 family protein [Fusobacterium sp. SYSU M8D902]|uniref:TrbI/VirB10 family protein n=1 Tax=Fusobacterium sp. SYSU M8D902 TaxID=3159562 RepID=UPI0032E45510
MAKKSLLNLPKEEGKQLDFKKILLFIIGIVTVIFLSFVSFSGNKSAEAEVKKEYNTARNIEESDNIVNRQQEAIQQALETNPLTSETYSNDKDSELEKLRLQKELEYEKMQLELAREKMQLERQRREVQLYLITNSNSNNLPSKKDESNQFENLTIPPIPPFPEPDENLQKKKREFLSEDFSSDGFVLNKRLEKAVGNYEVKAGTILPITLETAINSDLRGGITGVVKTDIYDSAKGNVLLIPAGSRVIGRYSSDVSFGQERVQAVFNRITLPNQESIDIDNMIMVDLMGATGVKDKVDTKLDKVFTSVIMSAILGVGSGAVKEDNEDDNWKNDAINGGGTQAINVGNMYAQKVLNVQPTLTVRNGFTVGLWVGKDLILKPYKW